LTVVVVAELFVTGSSVLGVEISLLSVKLHPAASSTTAALRPRERRIMCCLLAGVRTDDHTQWTS